MRPIRLFPTLLAMAALFLAFPLSASAGTLTSSPPSFTFNAQPYYFGSQCCPNIQIQNSGTNTQLGAASITGPDASRFNIANDGCVGQNLPDTGQCGVNVQFTPPNGPGSFTAQLEIPSDGSPNPLVVPLSAQALSGPNFVPRPSRIDFPATLVGSLASRQITFTNEGDSPGQVQQSFVFGPPVFSTTGDTCSQQQFAPGQSCTMTALFQPSAVREYQGAVFVIVGNSIKPVLTVDMSGAGRSATGPTVEITRKPKKKTRSTTAGFTFSSSNSNVIFECALDDDAFQTCTSPSTYTPHRGRHTFQVRAKEAGSDAGAAASYSWRILPKKKPEKS